MSKIGNFARFQFIDAAYDLDYLPVHAHLTIEAPLALYYIRYAGVGYGYELRKVLYSTETESLIDTRTLEVCSCFYDRSTGYIWFAEIDLGSPSTAFGIWYLDTSDDSINEITSQAGSFGTYVDIVVLSGTPYAFIKESDAGTIYIRVYDVSANPFVLKDSVVITSSGFLGLAIIIGTDIFIQFYGTTAIIVYKYDSVVVDITEELVYPLYSYPVIGSVARQLMSMAYDGTDILYFIGRLIADDLHYLLAYSITGTSITEHPEYNICLMLDRNCVGTSSSPWEFEKAFHVTSPYIYQISRIANNLYKIQDLGLAAGKTIKAITDTLLIDSDKNVYKYTDCMDKLLASGHEENIFSVPTGSITHSSELSADQLIEIYFYSTIRADYTLVFRGKAGIGELANKRWNYNLVNLGAKDFAQSVSYTASATGIDEVVIALVGQLQNPYIWCDTDSVPNIAVNMTYVFDNSTLWDALYVCAILANAYFWVETNGYLHFRTYASMEATGWYLGSGGLNYDPVGTSGTNINWVDSATLYDGACEIVESWQDHNNILRFQDDAIAGKDPSINHTVTQVTSGIFEFWIGTNDVTEIHHFGLQETAVGYIVRLAIRGSNLDYYDSLDAWQTIQAVVNDTWYHIKIQWYSGTPDTFDVYVNGTLEVDGVACNNNQVSGVDNIKCQLFGDSTTYLYLDAPALVGETDPRGVVYVVGYNDEDTLNQATNNISYPTSERMESKFNIWDIDGGWNEAANAPFNKRETDEEHILQYGPNQWTGRDQFSGARTQAALDAIAAGLKAWQGMMDAPYNASFRLIGRWYYPIGKYMNFQFTPETTFATAADMLISRCSYDHKNPKMIWMTLTQNIVRMG